MSEQKLTKKPVSKETYVVLIILAVFFGGFGTIMGAENFLNTMIATSFGLLKDVAFWIMAVAVLTSALAAILAEFGIFSLLNFLIAPITKVIYSLPGVSALGAISAYFSDNPAVISLSKEDEFRKRFKDYQIPVLCNLGTSFGMGFIVTISMMGLQGQFGHDTVITGGVANAFFVAALVGLLASVVGSVVSVRLLTRASRKAFGIDKDPNPIKKFDSKYDVRKVREGGAFGRALEAALDGGKNGVDIGLQIIPGILVISTLVLMLTYGPDKATGMYTGSAYEGIALIPSLGDYLMWLFRPLFGFSDAGALAFPLTSLGSAGAAVGNVPSMLSAGIANVKDVAVFTAMGITWSGYLSTHTSMMDALGARKLTGQAIFAHTIGGAVSGIVANYLFILITSFM